MEHHTASALLLASLAIAAGFLCALLFAGGVVTLVALVALIVVGFLIGFLRL